MSVRTEFRDFIARGNVFDLAVGIVIGGAFGTVVKSFVADLLMPPIGLLTGGLDFSNLFINLSSTPYASLADAQKAGAPTINYGVFINNLLSFLIIALAVFAMVKGYNRLRRQAEEAPPPPSQKECPFCRMAIPVEATRCGHCTSEVGAAA
ncbi:MAG: large conductance mechanosensitive channel protein MscL [Candidatus Palauibacterales bacterium]|nr:large conductance mechanosensitive channel protein MscL [Candidatus Palauibacterales bacterium]MDP2528214.1 large conductance mechanosensitive channel protein MscL [Candidatus Palauibacterales bacterium]MDP2584874.1 large conductance mechanosensitive channel protein MscL [Candidatus Palauibacterales bacterium]